MLPKTVIAGLAAVAFIVGTALTPSGASAAAAAVHGGGGPSFLVMPPFVGPGSTCEWVQVKYYSHKHAYWRSVQQCQ
jgi:hypothetical protein